MGINDREQDRKSTRRQHAKENRQRRAQRSTSADLETVDWLPLCALIAEMARHGGALRVGYTRDGGAYALGCYMGDDYATEYVRPNEDFEASLDEIGMAWLPDGGDSYQEMKARMRRIAQTS